MTEPADHDSIMRLLLIAAIFAMSMHHVQGDNILLIPAMAHSHVRYFSQVGRPLIDNGHRVHAIINGACEMAMEELNAVNIRPLTYFTSDKTCASEKQPSEKMQNQMAEAIMKPQSAIFLFVVLYMQSSMFVQEHEALFSDKTMLERIRELHIDLAIVDGMPLCLYNYIMPFKLGLPYISLSTAYHSSFVGVPELPSFAPVMLSSFSDQMTFIERLFNTIHHLGDSFLVMAFPSSRNSLVEQYAPDNESVSMNTLQRGSMLWLLNTDIALDYARVTLPHVVQIGGLSTRPARPLPTHLIQLAESAEGRMIIVSFGSLLKSLPQVVLDHLLGALVQIENATIIWKYNGPPLDNVPGNIKLLPWLPQADLLGHRNTQLFVTHCGNNGQFEALYHGVPMVGIPVFGDQPYNAARMQAKGFGLSIPLPELDSERLVAAINEVLANQSYSDRIKRASKLYRSRPQTARERAVYWIEHILTFGGEDLRSYGLQLEWYEYWCVDVLLFLFAIFVLLFFIFVRITRYCLQKCYPRVTSKEKQN